MNPEHKSLRASDRKYAVLSLATQRSWKGAWNGVSEYAAARLRKGNHIYVEGTLVSSTSDKEFGKGNAKTTVPLKTWPVKADIIRKH